MNVLWAIVVSSTGFVIGALPWDGTSATCERTAIFATIEGQRQRAAEGLPPNGARAYCVYTRQPPVMGELAPRPGVQL